MELMAVAHHLDTALRFETRPCDDFTLEEALNAFYDGGQMNRWTYRFDIAVDSIYISDEAEVKRAHEEFVKIVFGGNVATYAAVGYVYQFGVYKGLVVRVLSTNLNIDDYENTPMLRPAEIAAALAAHNETEQAADETAVAAEVAVDEDEARG